MATTRNPLGLTGDIIDTLEQVAQAAELGNAFTTGQEDGVMTNLYHLEQRRLIREVGWPGSPDAFEITEAGCAYLAQLDG